MSTIKRSGRRSMLPLAALLAITVLCSSGCNLLESMHQLSILKARPERPTLETDSAAADATDVVEASIASDPEKVTQAGTNSTVAPDLSGGGETATKEDVLAAMEELRVVDPEGHQKLVATLDLDRTDPSLFAFFATTIRARVAQVNKQSNIRSANQGSATSTEVATPTVLGRMVTTGGQAQPGGRVARDDRAPPDSSAPSGSTVSSPPRYARPTPESIALRMARISAAMSPVRMTDDSIRSITANLEMPEIDHAIRQASYNSLPMLHNINQQATAPTNQTADRATDRAEPSGDWRADLDRSIEALEAEIRTNPLAKSPKMFRKHQTLRMLYALAGRRDDAIDPIIGLDEPIQQFWKNQLYGLTIWLDDEHMPSEMERAAAAKKYLTRATNNLGEVATLVVENICFCRSVAGRGVVELFETNTFLPGQKVIIYAEIENFVGKQTPQGYQVKIRGTCQLFDSAGRMVNDYPPVDQEKLFNSRHAKIHVIHEFTMPDNLARGHYKLRLRIEDTIGGKINERELEFDIARR